MLPLLLKTNFLLTNIDILWFIINVSCIWEYDSMFMSYLHELLIKRWSANVSFQWHFENVSLSVFSAYLKITWNTNSWFCYTTSLRHHIFKKIFMYLKFVFTVTSAIFDDSKHLVCNVTWFHLDLISTAHKVFENGLDFKAKHI